MRMKVVYSKTMLSAGVLLTCLLVCDLRTGSCVEPAVTVQGAETVRRLAVDPSKVVVDVAGATSFTVTFSGLLPRETYLIERYDVPSQKEAFTSVVLSDRGTLRVQCPPSKTGLRLQLSALSRLEADACRALKAKPTHSPLQFSSFATMFENQQGKMARALAEYDKIIRDFPNDRDVTPGAYLGAAMSLMKLGDYEAALERCDAFVEKYRNETAPRGTTQIPLIWVVGASHNCRALILERQQKWEMALQEYMADLDFYHKTLGNRAFPTQDWRSQYVDTRDNVRPKQITATRQKLQSPHVEVGSMWTVYRAFLPSYPSGGNRGRIPVRRTIAGIIAVLLFCAVARAHLSNYACGSSVQGNAR